ncbi:GcrA family cell cycle regulator [Streptomyces sp. CBG9]|uniref:GcrA family cell cycle regulator n=1 Tax=Streptomyces sp. CBG9 TaxID=2762622 RepID=UPI001648A6FC|nr:GcrA family cell cycle regulator [Streptomyces sp. CBG9]
MTPEQRAALLDALNGGADPDDASRIAGCTTRALSMAARTDSELRAALDGQRPPLQRAARMGDYLAALARTGGDTAIALQAVSMDVAELDAYAAEHPRFDVALSAVKRWLEGESGVRGWRPLGELRGRKEEIEEQLRREWDAGTPREKIAEILGISIRLVDANRRRLGLKTRVERLTDEQKSQFTALWNAGRPSREIASKVGISLSTVTNHRISLGLPGRRPRYKSRFTEEQAETLRREWSAGTSKRSIAKLLGCTHQTVTNQVERLGLPLREGTSPSPHPARARQGKQGRYRQPTSEELAKLTSLWEQPGLSQKEIGIAVGVAPHLIRRWARDAGLPKHRSMTYDVFGQRLTVAEIARHPKCVVTEGTLRHRLAVGQSAHAAATTPANPKKSHRTRHADTQEDGE